jgi:hypothetical protein
MYATARQQTPHIRTNNRFEAATGNVERRVELKKSAILKQNVQATIVIARRQKIAPKQRPRNTTSFENSGNLTV